MFKFMKEKLKNFFKKSSKEIVKKVEEEEQAEEKEQERAEESEKHEETGEEVKKPAAKEETKGKAAKKGFFARIRKKFVSRIDEGIFQKIWNDLETLLLEGNVALEVVEKIKSDLQTELIGKEIERENVEAMIKENLKKAILNLMVEPFDLVQGIKAEKKPYILVFFGINGSGKTTTIAKIARFLQQNGLSCVLAASDTFRAASIEQLEKHADNLDIKMIKHGYGADAAAVAFDAVSYAKAHRIDVVLVDTAGRMHTQANLMKEMEKICRVTKPNLRIFIGEAIVGNDMIEQAKSFLEAVGIDSIIISKADVDEKGGAAISASFITKKPVLFLGTGQKYPDLEKFSRQKVLEGIGLG